MEINITITISDSDRILENGCCDKHMRIDLNEGNENWVNDKNEKIYDNSENNYIKSENNKIENEVFKFLNYERRNIINEKHKFKNN